MAKVRVHICTTCRQMGAQGEQEPRDGARLLRAVEAKFEDQNDVVIEGVECLSACDWGCNMAITGEGRWSYVYGKLDPDADVEDIVAGIRAYAQTQDGLVPWRERPVIFRKQSIARIPPQEDLS